ncbi:hypothetical protein [Sphingobium sp. Cam5-1]|uniref:hypothetical protein n=1 Tax=Sphingobium sp. Cam5-1 TaxID=2789327 RepID=UPI001E4D2707|nr:hypothetical protein [Sphingobium sp. Cam5-1]
MPVEDDDVRKRGLLQEAACYLSCDVDPVPTHILFGEASADLCLVPGFALALIKQDSRFAKTCIKIASNDRKWRDIDALKMAAEGTGQIQCCLKSSFLTLIIMYQEKNILHHSLHDKGIRLRRVIYSRYEETYLEAVARVAH